MYKYEGKPNTCKFDLPDNLRIRNLLKGYMFVR